MKDLNIGDIVALRTHPYLGKQTSIILGGDSGHISPLMVIVEKQSNSRPVFDENTALEADKLQLKCLFYSSRDQFEEIWLSSQALKIIDDGQPTQADYKSLDLKEINALFAKKLVVLKTNEIELAKKKSSIKIDSLDGNVASKIDGLVTFSSPEMQVIEVKRYDHKDALYYVKTGNQKRFVPKWIAKCKWFSTDSNKFIEKFIPIEALSIIAEIEEKTIEELAKAISNDKNIRHKLANDLITIFKPQFISYRGGYYFLNHFDLIMNKNRSVRILPSSIFEFPENNCILQVYPDFDFQEDVQISKKSLVASLVDRIEKSIKNKSYIRIKYKNANDEVSTRTLDNYHLVTVNEIENEKEFNNEYIKGYCNSKKEIRTFRVDRIQRLEVLDLTYQERITKNVEV